MSDPSKTIEKAASMSARTWGMLVALVFVALVLFYPINAAAKFTGSKLSQVGKQAAESATAASQRPWPTS